MVCVAMPKKDSLTEKLEAALSEAELRVNAAVERKQAIENILRQHGYEPETLQRRIPNRGRAPKGVNSALTAAFQALFDHGALSLSELAELTYNQYGAHTNAADPKAALYSRVKKERESKNPGIVLEGHKYLLTPAKRREMEQGQ